MGIQKALDAIQNASDKLAAYANKDNKPVKCPRCKSSNISIVPKRISIIALGVKKEAICLDCSKHFKI